MIAEYIIKITAIVWLIAGLIEWLFVIGILTETNPKPVTFLFRSCAVLNLLIAYGLWQHAEWARVLGLVVVVFQFWAHSWMIFLEMPKPQVYRIIELAMFIFYLVYFSRDSVAALFH